MTVAETWLGWSHQRGRRQTSKSIAWARRSRLHEFVALARTIKRFHQLIWNTLHKHGVSNARSEATNTHIRALTKRAYGYHLPEALIVMAMLTRDGLNPELPGRGNDPRKRQEIREFWRQTTRERAS